MMMVITSLIVSPLSRWRCFLPSLNRGCWAFNSGKVPWQNSSQSTKSCTMSISVLLFVVGTSGANLSRFLPKKESRDSTTELISLLCFNFYIELTLDRMILTKPHKITAPRHADIFLERYARLLGWALTLTEHDRQLAEDLLHDAFIQFSLGEPDLNAIENLDGYLRTMLRNIHISHARRASWSRMRQLSAVEYDSAEISLRSVDPRAEMLVKDQLRAVCRYACGRKETSKAASDLILRFFHGYYPEEIARVSRASRPAVKERLRLARAEARLYLEDPSRLNFINSIGGDSLKEAPHLSVG